MAYLRYHNLMHGIGRKYGVDVERVTAAFCALSPNNDYLGNLRSLVSMLTYYQRGENPADATVSTYKAAAKRAALYLCGIPFLGHAKGQKTRAFYQNISEPTLWGPVTVDGHMIGAYLDEPLTMKDAQGWLTKRRYVEVAMHIQDMAADLRVMPHQVQATIWFARKRRLGVVYTPQMDLLSPGEGQRTTYDPDELHPYPPKVAKPLRQTDTQADAEADTQAGGADHDAHQYALA
jgi:hypothetical protein